MSSTPKPEILSGGTVVEIRSHRHNEWFGHIAGPGYNSEQITRSFYPTVTALRNALRAGTATFETYAERHRRLGRTVIPQANPITQSAAWQCGIAAAKEQMAAVEHRHCAANKCWLNVTDGEEYCHRHKPVDLSVKGPS